MILARADILIIPWAGETCILRAFLFCGCHGADLDFFGIIEKVILGHKLTIGME